MKVRSGFVSNSSSSSFVALAINLDKHPGLEEKFVVEDDYDRVIRDDANLPENTEVYYHEGFGTILGWQFGYGSDYEFGCEDVEIDKLAEYAKELEKATGVKPKIMGGTYMC